MQASLAEAVGPPGQRRREERRMHVVLICNAGLSSGIMMVKMREVAEPGDTVEAYQQLTVDQKLREADVVLLSPGIRHALQSVRDQVAGLGIPVAVMDMRAYGTMDGAAVYRQARELYREAHE